MQAAKVCLIFSWDIRSHGSNWMTLNQIHVNPGHDPGMERQSMTIQWWTLNTSTIWLSWFLSQTLVLEVWLTLNPESQSPISSGVEFRRRLWVACNGMCRGTIQSTSVSAEDQMKKLLMGSVGAVQGHVNDMYDMWQRPFLQNISHSFLNSQWQCCFFNFPRYVRFLHEKSLIFRFSVQLTSYPEELQILENQWEPGTFRHWLLRLERQTAFCEAERENGRSDQHCQLRWFTFRKTSGNSCFGLNRFIGW